MSEETARRLTESYVTGWKKHDVEMILQPLSIDCVVTESHGPTYRGAKLIRKWAEQWINAGNKVKHWDMKNFCFAPNENTAFFEWTFDCFADKRDYHIDGASVVTFKDRKVSSIHEYLMSHPAFDWEPKHD